MPTSVRLSDELDQRLDRLAAKTGRSKSFYVKQAVEEYITDLEDFYLAERRGGRRKEDELIPLNQVLADYGMGN